jgi:hypothetical protein
VHFVSLIRGARSYGWVLVEFDSRGCMFLRLIFLCGALFSFDGLAADRVAIDQQAVRILNAIEDAIRASDKYELSKKSLEFEGFECSFERLGILRCDSPDLFQIHAVERHSVVSDGPHLQRVIAYSSKNVCIDPKSAVRVLSRYAKMVPPPQNSPGPAETSDGSNVSTDAVRSGVIGLRFGGIPGSWPYRISVGFVRDLKRKMDCLDIVLFQQTGSRLSNLPKESADK